LTRDAALEAAFDRYGPSTAGTVAIALHGAVANRKTWLPLARVLPGGVELWCPDLPGHGARRDEPFVLESALATVTALVTRAAPRRVILAGDSLGGYVALIAAARNTAGVAAVVAGGFTWSMAGIAGALARASDVPVRFLETFAGDARIERFVAASVPRFTDADTAAEIVRAGLRVRSRSESLAELAGLDLVAHVRTLRVPIVFVNGARDWPTRAGERMLLRAARDSVLVLGPHAGHGVGLLDPATFARALALAAAS
jgi:pimeloyl-ACP methyl ester carboxylesterase